MNKLFTKIAALALGMTMAIGVGVAVGSNKGATPVHAATENVETIFTSKSWADSKSLWSSNKDASAQDSSKGPQVQKAASGAGATTKTSYSNVSAVSIKLSKSNKGVGSVTLKVGSTTVLTQSSFTSTNTYYNGTISTPLTGNISFVVTCTTSSIYVESVKWTYDNGSSDPKLEFSETAISGEEGIPFSFTWTESNLTSAITWSPTSESTDVIDYTVNTSTKTVSGTLKTAGTVTLTGTSGTASDSVVFTVTEHENNRKYTVTSTSTVSESGDTMTGTSSTFVNTYSTKDQITSPNTMTLTISGMTKVVNINKLVFSMHSNKSSGAGYVTIAIDGGDPTYIEGTSSGTEFTNFGDDTTDFGTTYRDITWDDLDYSAKSSIVIVIKCTTNSLYCQWFDIFFSEKENTDVVTALSVSPNSWSGYDSGTINVSDYTVTVAKGDVTGTSADYDFQGIGSGADDNFVARIADFTSGHPTTSDTRLQWKAKYPTTVGGSTYLYTYVSLTVTADTISSIAVSGSMPTDYSLGGSWSTEGLVVTATYASGAHDTLSSGLTWNFYSDSELTTEVATPDALGVGDNQTIYVKATYSGVTPSKVSAGYPQVVNVTKEPGVVNFGTAEGAIQMSNGSGSGTDTLGNSVSATCNSGAYQDNQASLSQVGSKNNPLTNWTITISFTELVGIDSFEIKFQGSSDKSNQEYTATAHHNELGDQEIMNGGVDGSTLVVDSTDNTYSTLNANSLVVTFTGSSYGVKLYYISYQLGSPVKEFGTLDHIAISQESTHDTLFKVNDTFSSTGMIIIATDTTGFSQNYTSGFTTTYDDHLFIEEDVGEGIENTVSLTIKGVTKTTSYTFDVINPPTYSLVETQDELYEGMKVIIYGSNNKALGTENSGYFDEGAVTFDGDVINDGSAATEFTVRIYGTKGFALQHGGKYLQYHGTGNNAYLDSTLDEKAVWTLNENGLTNVDASTRVLRHNSSATRFACYTTSSGSIVSLYVSSATPKTDSLGAETFAYKYLHMRDYDPELHEGVPGDGYCSDSTNHYYTTAKDFYNSASFSAEEKVEFAKLSDAVKRLQAWAKANGETFDPNAKSFTPNANLSIIKNVFNESNSMIAIVVIVSVISVSAIGGYFFLRKRREEN